MVEVYAVNITEPLTEMRFEHFRSLLSMEKQERISRFRYPNDVKRTLYGDVLIRYLVKQKLMIPNNQMEFGQNEYGKPFLKGYPVFHYNISHAGNWVICAVSSQPIGVDIEEIKPIDLEIAKRYFARSEYNSIISNPADRRQTIFYHFWTAKESYIKYDGRGLSIPLNSFSVLNNGVDQYKVDLDNRCFIQTVETLKGYVLSICQNTMGMVIQKVQLGEIEI